MAVVLDTDELPEADRADAVMSAMNESFVATYVPPENPAATVSARMEVWDFGSTSIFRSAMSGQRLIRTAKRTRSHPSSTLSLAVQQIGESVFDQAGEQRILDTGSLLVHDDNSPYEYSWTGLGACTCLFVRLDDLGLPADLIRDAGTRLRASPIYNLMVDHVLGMTRNADALSADPAAAALGVVSIELARALVASAAHDTRHRRDAMAATLLTQIRAYVGKHLANPGLTPAIIAAAHHISVRHLYKLCAGADFSLHDWITTQRLEGARNELAGLESRHRSIAMVAQRWGFSNPTHFSRRFRDAYGITPRDWRRLAGRDDVAEDSSSKA
ncbi:helix-turn-helix domain-containing protein [Mycolicibacterium sphagni]|uniref:AraC family transcriptional regulator n=1 Tax=Mycolicibacterium sphagni TaxID=1786 RepID=A0A255DKR4_9MYCO|nr:helix-turn-helix domain-containing protein [Mycolicibacterium sphagni]OYN79680.1 AraC family transcriptional regulator [Mycolicibacterium sphagni]